jgi:hypothetical protein
MSDADYLALGDWNANCSICGQKFKASELKKHWQGQWRCARDWEPRQPQDFVRGIAEAQTPPWTQVAGQSFVAICSFDDRTAFPHRAIPGCVEPNFISLFFDPSLPFLD